MEKIKKALDRARYKSSTNTNNSISSKLLGRSTIESNQEQKIIYTETKTVEIDDKVLRDRRIIIHDDADAIADRYKLLRTHVIQRMKANSWNTLAITSPSEGCGKTTTSINLAISLAREVNHSVLLVDLDLRRPCIQQYFFTDLQPGISEYLSEDIDISKILFNPSLERLVILPGSKAIGNSSEILSSPKIVRLVSELKSRYPNRIIIFDMPPLLSCDDVIAFMPLVDSVMLVIEDGKTRKDELTKAYDLLDKQKIIGSVLNKCQENAVDKIYY